MIILQRVLIIFFNNAVSNLNIPKYYKPGNIDHNEDPIKSTSTNKCFKIKYFSISKPEIEKEISNLDSSKACQDLIYEQKLSNLIHTFLQMLYIPNSTDCDLFLIYSTVLGLLDQLQIFWWFCLIELPGLLTGLGLLELWHLIYPSLSIKIGMQVFFTNLGLMKFQVRYLA